MLMNRGCMVLRSEPVVLVFHLVFDGTGSVGFSESGVGGRFSSSQNTALIATAIGNKTAVMGSTGADGTGIYGTASGASGRAIWDDSGVGFAGFFTGKIHVNGTLSKSAGSFKIDHPLDPENKYLSHSFVESPDMMNLSNGNCVLDADGRATVDLPDYFEALNRDFRYQLTAIGGPALLYIAEKVADNQFVIGSNAPGIEVSWQVTVIRKDAYAQVHPIIVEEEKSQEERGTYLAPLEHGQPESMGVDAARRSGLTK